MNIFIFSIDKKMPSKGRPKAVYANPCDTGAPLTDDLSGAPVACALRSEDGTICPQAYECTAVPGSTQAVCCPTTEEEMTAESSEDYSQTDDRPQTSEFPYLLLKFSKWLLGEVPFELRHLPLTFALTPVNKDILLLNIWKQFIIYVNSK